MSTPTDTGTPRDGKMRGWWRRWKGQSRKCSADIVSSGWGEDLELRKEKPKETQKRPTKKGSIVCVLLMLYHIVLGQKGCERRNSHGQASCLPLLTVSTLIYANHLQASAPCFTLSHLTITPISSRDQAFVFDRVSTRVKWLWLQLRPAVMGHGTRVDTLTQ